MHKKVNQFLDSVCSHIKYTPAHQEIRDELALHIEELKEEFLYECKNEESALDMAISAMGDCEEIGRRLHKQHKPETEWSILGLTFVITLIGGIVIYASQRYTFSVASFERYLFSAVFGIAVLIVLYLFDYTKLRNFTWPAYFLLLLFHTIPLFQNVMLNGESFFVIVGSFVLSLNFTTVLFIVSLVGFIDKCRGKGLIGILKLNTLVWIPILLVMFQQLSHAFIMLFVYIMLMIPAFMRDHFGLHRNRKRVLLFAVCFLGLLLISIFIGLSSSYKIARIRAFIDNKQISSGDVDYQAVIADKWLKSSEILGSSSVNQSNHDISETIPDITTNFAFVNVFLTLGYAVGFALILIIAVYIERMLFISTKIKNHYGFYLSLSACILLAVQFLIGILMNLHLFPLTGIYIPFLSYGGVGYVSSMALVGLILSIWRRNKLGSASSPYLLKKSPAFITYAEGMLVIDFKRLRQ